MHHMGFRQSRLDNIHDAPAGPRRKYAPPTRASERHVVGHKSTVLRPAKPTPVNCPASA